MANLVVGKKKFKALKKNSTLSMSNNLLQVKLLMKYFFSLDANFPRLQISDFLSKSKFEAFICIVNINGQTTS